MPMYDAKPSSTKYYVIEKVGEAYHERYLYKLGKIFLIGEFPDQSSSPEFNDINKAFRFDTYSAACHYLARWMLPGTYRVVWVDDENDIFEWAQDGPMEPSRFDERDWREYHHWNGKSN